MASIDLAQPLVVAGLAAFIGLAELREASYKRAVLPLFPLAKH